SNLLDTGFPDVREHFRLAMTGVESSTVSRMRDVVFDIHYSPRRNNAGEISEIIGVATDITERLRAERLQIELEKEQEVIALKERFLATASHDFRTPLAIIKLSANTLATYFDRISPEQRAAKLTQIGTQVDHMSQQLEAVLTMSRMNSGKLEFNPTKVI